MGIGRSVVLTKVTSGGSGKLLNFGAAWGSGGRFHSKGQTKDMETCRRLC